LRNGAARRRWAKNVTRFRPPASSPQRGLRSSLVMGNVYRLLGLGSSILGWLSTWLLGWLSTLLLLAPLAASANEGDAVSAVQLLREGGCGGIVPAARPLHHDAALDRAAAQWADGSTISAAAHYNGYPAGALSGVHVSGPDSSLVQLLRSTSCRTITDRSLHDMGVYHRGLETWFLLASRYAVAAPGPAAITAKTAPTPIQAAPPAPTRAAPSSAAPSPTPPSSAAPALAARALQLVNDVRGRGARCGERSFGPAPPVRLSGILNDVALGHAADMARHAYFEHDDLSGHTPADRVRAVGYLEKLVGENIAYGPESADEVVKGWLDSPGHCENIMDPRFAEMGIAYSPGHTSRRGLYWVQLLAAPKA
jgi:uncharacterized protein YkwD